jgi:hypothetical protein
MNAAILKDPIDIYELVTTKTEYGTIQTSYNLKYHTRAYVRFNSENMTVSEGEVYFPINKTFIVRAYVPVVETDQIEHEGTRYKILSINKNKYYNDIEINTTTVNI